MHRRGSLNQTWVATLRRRVPAIVVVVGIAGCAARTQPTAPQVARASPHITAAAIAGPVRFLSDDLLEGRGPGTRGDALARAYIASEMQALGLEPGAADGGWEQPFELVGITSRAPSRWRFHRGANETSLNLTEDFVASSRVEGDTASIENSELVFVGYGMQAPEYDWDDFKGSDLRGKTLLFMNNDPDWDPELFAGKRRLYYGRWTYKYESAARQGAAAAIVIHTTESASYPWQTVQTSWSGENSHLPGADEPLPIIEAWVTEDSAKEIVALAGHALDDLYAQARRRDFAPVALGVRTSLTLQQTARRYQTANVIGVLAGSDPAPRDQAIVYTAHHDHLGVKIDVTGEPMIYNGALDNASGVAQLLAVARGFVGAEPPRRSVVFLAVGAEEQGLLGSAYYVAHATVPPSDIVANINFDGANIWGPTRDVAVVGYGKSTMDAWATAAARRQDRKLVDERFPERGSFYRSDQFNFARAGVPVLYARGGTDFVGRPPGWGREQVDAWIQQHYHQPSDDYSEDWNLDGVVEDAQLAFAVGYALAMSDEMPQWMPGDEFEAVRLESLKP